MVSFGPGGAGDDGRAAHDIRYDHLVVTEIGPRPLLDFEQEAALHQRQRLRVSDAYCNRGSRYPREKYDLAISDLNRAIQIRGTSDPCECEPYNPLLAIYLNQAREHDKAREVVAPAQRSGKWIDPEYLEQLKASSADR